MKAYSIIILVLIALISFGGCAKDPLGLSEEEKKNFGGGGDAGANGTADNPSGTTKDVTAADSQSAQTEVASGNSALESIMLANPEEKSLTADVSSANIAYKAAIEADPNNTEAQFGAAATELIMANQVNEVNSVLDTLLSDQGLFKTRMIPLKIKAGAVANPELAVLKVMNANSNDLPKISELQKAIKDSVLPAVVYALDRLSIIENDPDFKFIITPHMQGDTINGDTLEVDLGEVFIIDAGLRALRGVLLTLIAYNVDVDVNGSYDWIGEADDNDSIGFSHLKRLHQSSTFLTLHEYGADAMKSAIANFRSCLSKLDSGLAYIRAETDDQIDDLIKAEYLDSADAELVAENNVDITTVEQALDTITAILSGPYTVEPETGARIKINLGAIFDNPISDLKSKFPSIRWREPSTWLDTSMYTDFDYVGDSLGDYTLDSCVYNSSNDENNCYYSSTPGVGNYNQVTKIDSHWNPIEFNTSAGYVLPDSIEDPSDLIFPDYTLGGLFPDMTTMQKWVDFIEAVDPDSSTNSPKVLGFHPAGAFR